MSEEQELRVHVEIFAIGNELCYGRVCDTNSFWLADQVTQLGAIVDRITVIPDDIEKICGALRDALDRRPHFIVLTGGLGPTSDDLTVEALSVLSGADVIASSEILQVMSERRSVPIDELPPNLVKMARSIKGARSLPNPVGWAPVILLDTAQTAVAAMPGPPREMRACFTEYLAKKIGERTRYRSVARRVLVTMYESQVSSVIDELVETIPGVYFKPLVADYQREKGLPVDVIVFAEDEKTCNKRTEEAIRRLRELVKKKGATLACSDQ